jgi:hypothetical protein
MRNGGSSFFFGAGARWIRLWRAIGIARSTLKGLPNR